MSRSIFHDVAGMLHPFPQQSKTHCRPVFNIGGGGILFWWMAGVMKELGKGVHFSNTYTFRGASAGALAAVVGACQVDMDRALDLANELAEQYNVFTRPLGLVGVWGSMLRDWLETVLPEDAAQRCSGQVEVVVTAVPAMRRVIISEFNSKNDVVEACLASAHVPFLMDGKMVTAYKGEAVVDGAILDGFSFAKGMVNSTLVRWLGRSSRILSSAPFVGVSKESVHSSAYSSVVHLDHRHDEELAKQRLVSLEFGASMMYSE